MLRVDKTGVRRVNFARLIPFENRLIDVFPFRALTRVIPTLALFALVACGKAPPPGGPQPGSQQDVAQLAKGIMALDPAVDPAEARRVAEVAYGSTYEQAVRYQINDTPLVHNMKVNSGQRPRGLCYHWADDLEARLRENTYETLQLHRAIANAENPFRIEHSTVIVSPRGDTMFDGMVLDAWRAGGVLTWVPTAADTKYGWVPRQEVFAYKRALKQSKADRQPQVTTTIN